MDYIEYIDDFDDDDFDDDDIDVGTREVTVEGIDDDLHCTVGYGWAILDAAVDLAKKSRCDIWVKQSCCILCHIRKRADRVYTGERNKMLARR